MSTTEKSLRIAEGLTLPLDLVTQTLLLVGKRGSGKSNTAAVIVEQLYRARLPFVVLDPTDTWWGLKASRNGEKGLGVYVFGGHRADLPLEASGGALIADVLCEHRQSMVLSVKHLSGRARSEFMVAFARTLFQQWAGGPLHIVLEEAHELAPQSVQNGREGEQQMLGAFKQLWKLGRAQGIGGMAVTQRPASLSKDITTQSEILVAHRTIGPQDVAAIGEWVKYHGGHREILAELPTLPTGTAFFWAPEFPEAKPLGLQRVAVRRRETFDSAATPKVGEQRVEPRALAPVDIERLRSKMDAAIARAKADDPRTLQAEIRRLTAELAAKPAAPPPAPKVIDRLALKDGQLARAEAAVKGIDALVARLEGVTLEAPIAGLREIAASITAAIHATAAPAPAPAETRTTAVRVPAVPPRSLTSAERSIASQATGPTATDRDLSGGVLRILTAVAQYPEGVTREQLTVLTGYKKSSRDSFLQRLTAMGLVLRTGDRLSVTHSGRKALGSGFTPLPTGVALQQYWLDTLTGGEREILRALLEAPGRAVLTREELSARTGYKKSSRDTFLQRLAARELVAFDRADGTVSLSRALG